MAKRKKPSDEQNQDNGDNANDADNFGLPDINYKPLDAPQENPENSDAGIIDQEPIQEAPPMPAYSTEETPRERESESNTRSSYSSSYMEEENKSKAPAVIGVVIALVVIVAGFLIYQFVWKPQKDKERQEQIAQEKARRDQAEKVRQQQQAEEAERQRLAAEAATATAAPTQGVIETLTDPTKRYYVVISSAIDDDLVMDYAKKLSAKGVSTKIIPPFGSYKFSRLAIGDYDTFANAQSGAEAVKTEYGGAVWVLRF